MGLTCDCTIVSLATVKVSLASPEDCCVFHTFRVQIGAYSPALGGDTGTWGLGVGLGDYLCEIFV